MPKLNDPSACPNCGKVMDAATAVDGSGAVPQEGDVSVCLYCGEALQFGPDLDLERLDWSRLDAEEIRLVKLAQGAILDE